MAVVPMAFYRAVFDPAAITAYPFRKESRRLGVGLGRGRTAMRGVTTCRPEGAAWGSVFAGKSEATIVYKQTLAGLPALIDRCEAAAVGTPEAAASRAAARQPGGHDEELGRLAARCGRWQCIDELSLL